MTEWTKDALLQVGFVDVAVWRTDDQRIAYELDGPRAQANTLLLDQSNALYAFARGDAVQYIGKTTQGIRARFGGYRNPGKGQATNIRCNAKIRELLAKGEEVRVLVFVPIADLRYGDFDLNLAAGLEDALIKAFKPPWNGRDKGKPITEEAEREKAEEAAAVPPHGEPGKPSPTMTNADAQAAAGFKVALGATYYHQGIINPGPEASRHLGADGEYVQVLFEDGTEPVLSKINRSANANGSVRVIGQNRRIAQWFQAHFRLGNSCEARVLDRNRILLLRTPMASGGS
ncbi:GIY-YIG nuclease family protein [Methylorubrum thiocyanatum]